MVSLESLKERAHNLKCDVYALYLARGDPRIPFPAKVVIVLTVAYALSPIDLIPDFIPVIGYLDDLIIVPAGIAYAIKLMPENMLEEYRERAKIELANKKIHSWAGFAIILLIWLLVLFVIIKIALGILG
ncbi:MAG: hypothetical protein A4E69_00164 [Syntrophus sp. PtaB.Bin138]|nr:MAG: hypothetical protein A4E69_00164 [Syntrophus sp. PtaB.Bin138]